MKLDWDRLKVFQTVAEEGSINAAARTLCLSYGKVSKDLEELERTLGHQLFDRSKRGLVPTIVGEDILKTARNMSDSVRSIIQRANDRNPDHLVICARDGMATYWLARQLPTLLKAHPNVRIFLKVLPTTPNLIDGDADIAIQYEAPSAPNVIAKQLGWLHYILYASPDYIAHNGEPKALPDLHNHQCLRLSGEEYQVERWQPAASAFRAILPNTVETDTSSVLVEACASGGGVAVMPSFVSECEPRLSALTEIKPLASVQFWLAFSDRARTHKDSEVVLDWIRACFDLKQHACFREVYLPPARGADLSGRAML